MRPIKLSPSREDETSIDEARREPPGAAEPAPHPSVPDVSATDESAPDEPSPEQLAGEVTEQHVRDLIVAYQATLDRVEAMPTLVWMPWARSGPGRFVKVPYVRLFLRFFVSHHVNRNLTALNRRLQAIAALADDSDATKGSRDMVRYFQQSLPAPPYRTLIFAVIAAALVIALPLQAVGNVFYVLDLVGALLRLDVGYAGRAFASKELGPTIRSLFVLLIGLTVVGGVLTSPFGLKRALFNLYPWTDEDFSDTGARTHGHRTDGIYALEAAVFDDVKAKQPPEGRWDLGFQTSLLVVLCLFETLLLTIVVAYFVRLPVVLDLDLPGTGPTYDFQLPALPLGAYLIITAGLLAGCVLLWWRVGHAWRVRRRPRPGAEPRELSARRAAPPG